MTDDTLFLPDLSPVQGREIHARFDAGSLSSDGGVLLLRQIERKLKFADKLAACLHDDRDPERIVHSQADMIRERMFAVTCGYEDCDDLDQLRHDPALKLACERLPESGDALASQPTLSRLENAPSWRELSRMGLALIDLFCDSFARAPNHIVLDIDDTIDRTHGGQKLSLFNTHGGGYCFQPIHIYDAATGKPVCFLLRPGKRPSGAEAAQLLRLVIGRIRARWPRVEITVRGGSHYGTPEVMALLEQRGCFYMLGLPTNNKLKNIAQPWCDDVATRRAIADKDKLRRFFQTSYGAASWGRERTVKCVLCTCFNAAPSPNVRVKSEFRQSLEPPIGDLDNEL